MQSFENLKVWQKAMDFCVEVYSITSHFPKTELFALTDQLKRACVSIPSNISEGCQRQTQKEFHHFLYIAYGSCAEVRTQLLLAKRLNYFPAGQTELVLAQLQEIEKMLNTLIRKIRTEN